MAEHPCTVINAAGLKEVKRRFNLIPGERDKFPQYKAFLEFQKALTSAMTTPISAPATLPASTASRGPMDKAADAAFTCALGYALGGTAKYNAAACANQAHSILMSWAKKPTKWPGNKSSSGLHIGRHLVGFPYAYDLMHDWIGWNETDRKTFRDWLYENPLACCRAIWDNTDRAPGHPKLSPTAPPEKLTGDNWMESAGSFIFAAAAACDDATLMTYARNVLSQWFANSTWRIRTYPYGPGGALWPSLTRDIQRTVRVNGKLESLKGLVYMAEDLSDLGSMFEILRYHDYNFWQKETNGANIGMDDLMWGYFRWSELEDAFWYKHEEQVNQGVTVRRHREEGHRGIELFNNRFNFPDKYTNWLANGGNRRVFKQHHVTLLKGNMKL